MTAAERQELIMATLRTERKAKICNFANAFGCSERTVLRDIEALTASFPLETSPGRYDGGVKLAENYNPPGACLNPEQIQVLKRFASSASRDDRMILNSILDQFSPTRQGGVHNV